MKWSKSKKLYYDAEIFAKIESVVSPEAQSAYAHLSVFGIQNKKQGIQENYKRKYILNAVSEGYSNFGKGKYSFVHLPKTGGTSVEAALKNQFKAGKLRFFYHSTFSRSGNREAERYCYFDHPTRSTAELNNTFVFTNVRSNWSLLYSNFKAILVGRFITPNLPDKIFLNRDFDYYVNYCIDESESWPSKAWINFHMFEFDTGLLFVDWINRMERLSEDYAAMDKVVDLDIPPIGHENARGDADYRSVYSDALAERVGQTWAGEIEAFGFDFDKGLNGDGVLTGDVRTMKGKARYDRAANRLILDGK